MRRIETGHGLWKLSTMFDQWQVKMTYKGFQVEHMSTIDIALHGYASKRPYPIPGNWVFL